MLVVKHETKGVVGRIENPNPLMDVGDYICDEQNKVNYRITKSIYSLTSGERIGVIVE